MQPLKALTLSIGNIETPVITKYQLGLLVHRLYCQKKYDGEPVNLHKPYADSADFNKYLKQLLGEGVLSQRRDLPSGVYTLLGSTRWEAEDATCTIDPFCYLSHLSAMSYHGITDRIPIKLFVSSPGSIDWKAYAQERMRKDLKEGFDFYIEGGMPRLQRIGFKKVGRVDVHCFNSVHHGAYKNVKNRTLRVSTIGRTFLDMLRNPELCGGINHVLDVFEEYGKRYLRLITDEIDTNGKKIDKVRAGYILDERLQIKNDVIDGWSKFAQRGGSRKLDASAEYKPEWSDKWCLSLNVFE
ncbi:type IV toxin-antitoxin system AbiEi family antitoxin domain-containing protein [Gilvimarinus agarilyticus]|uniref:type IV toxin-antitoxin system AbiEi family antitoxin domain-containing protein n=1 Tax=Gilvimarinus agarilyticus TaxID=679259 RepID=UPI0005A191ED|nr:hypothetical protein [Gilvimarinus agarilyticus]